MGNEGGDIGNIRPPIQTPLGYSILNLTQPNLE